MSDVPLGVFLSGGIDSSAIAAIAARLSPPGCGRSRSGFDDPRANELAYAQASRRRDRLRAITRSWSRREQFFDALPRLIWHEDEPIAFPSSVPLYFLSRLAGEHVKVVLTGEGADELFLGYNRYRVTHWNARLGRPYWSLDARRGPTPDPPGRAARARQHRPHRPAHLPRSRSRLAPPVSR